jgi:uncharacterized protein YegP (UPF0339 family)
VLNQNKIDKDTTGNYHIYVGAANGQDIFKDEEDYQSFLTQCKKCLLKGGAHDIPEVLAYCLFPNGFHMLVHQATDDTTDGLVRAITERYDIYHAHKYMRTSGSIFDKDHKEAYVATDEDLLLASRVIHAGPREWLDYPYSSIRAYLYDDVPEWLNKTRIADLYGSAESYLAFLKDWTTSYYEFSEEVPV